MRLASQRCYTVKDAAQVYAALQNTLDPKDEDLKLAIDALSQANSKD